MSHLNTPSRRAQVLERPRTTQLLRSVSNSFKKGTDRLKRGLTPRSRTSSQTVEPEDAVPPPPPSAAEPPAPAMQLDNHVTVNIAEVSPHNRSLALQVLASLTGPPQLAGVLRGRAAVHQQVDGAAKVKLMSGGVEEKGTNEKGSEEKAPQGAAANGPEAPPAGQLHAPPLPPVSEKAAPPPAADPWATTQEASATEKAPQHELGLSHAPAPAAPAPTKEPPAETDFSFSTPAQPHTPAAEPAFGAPPARKEEPYAAYEEEEGAPVAGSKAGTGEDASFDVDVVRAR